MPKSLRIYFLFHVKMPIRQCKKSKFVSIHNYSKVLLTQNCGIILLISGIWLYNDNTTEVSEWQETVELFWSNILILQRHEFSGKLWLLVIDPSEAGTRSEHVSQNSPCVPIFNCTQIHPECSHWFFMCDLSLASPPFTANSSLK